MEEDERHQLGSINNLPVYEGIARAKKSKHDPRGPLQTFNRFNPLRHLGERMENPFITPPSHQRTITPQAPICSATLGEQRNSKDRGNENSPNARGRAPRHRPRKPNGQFAKSRQPKQTVSEDVEMGSVPVETRCHGTPGQSEDPRTARVGRSINEAFRRIEGVSHELTNL